MGQAKVEIDVAGAPADVWALVGDFGGIAGWMPGMESCRVEGEDRILETMGMTITERLVARDDATMAITYAIVDGVPVDHHEATITVAAAGDGSHVTWEVAATPDEMCDLMSAVYQSALEALKAHVEG